MNPLVSIIIPTLNEEENLVVLLDHLFATGNLREMEVIVADGGSSDATVKVASGFPAKCVTGPKGRAIQQNCGAKISRGSILYFVHADTIPPATWLSDLQRAVHQGSHLGGFRFRFVSERKILRFNSFMTRFNVRAFRGGDQSIFIARSLFDQLNGFDEKFEIMEEYDLLRRASSLGIHYRLLEGEVLVSDRKYHNNSWLRVNWANTVAMWMFNRKSPPGDIRETYFRLLKRNNSRYQQ